MLNLAHDMQGQTSIIYPLNELSEYKGQFYTPRIEENLPEVVFSNKSKAKENYLYPYFRYICYFSSFVYT